MYSPTNPQCLHCANWRLDHCAVLREVTKAIFYGIVECKKFKEVDLNGKMGNRQ